MKRKITGLLIVSMIAAFLTGCGGEKVTAEDLIDNAINTDYIEYELEYCVDYSTMIDGVKDRANYTVNVESKNNPTVCYQNVKGDVEYSTEVYNYIFSSEAYRELDGNVENTYTLLEDSWVYEDWKVDHESYIPEMKSDMFNDLELEEKDNGYIVKGIVTDYDAFYGFDYLYLKDILSRTFSYSDAIATLEFDKDGTLESIEVDIEVDEDEIYYSDTLGEVNIYGVTISIEIKSLEGDGVKIPSEIIRDAIDIDEWESTTNESAEDMESTDENAGVSMGIITDTTYENADFNIAFTTPDANWTLYSREDVDTVYNATIEKMTDQLGNYITNSAVFMDMYAINYSTASNVNVTIENRNEVAGILSELEYAQVGSSAIPTTYENMGATDVNLSIASVEVFDEVHYCIESDFTYMSIPFYQVQAIVKTEEYVVIITSTSNISYEDAMEVFDGFYRLAE